MIFEEDKTVGTQTVALSELKRLRVSVLHVPMLLRFFFSSPTLYSI